jgi:hypothetical protein
MKKKTIVIKVCPKEELKKIRTKAGPVAARKLAKATDKVIDDIVTHFRARKGNGGWPLGYHQYYDQIASELLGFELGWYLACRMAEVGLQGEYVPTEIGSYMITKQTKRRAK